METANVRALCFSVAIVLSVLSRQSLAAGEGSKEADKITALPGQPRDATVQQYSGYVNVDEKDGRTLFYYFVEAAADAAKRPLFLWLNGGPGCSSFGIGAFQEVGPYRVDTDGKTLCKNKYAWNSEGNILFLESPAGTGFSYAVNTEVYKTMGDNMTTRDTYTFLVKWMERFPEYKGRELFIIGESYAGHYVPEISTLILASKNAALNLKGIIIGNGILEFKEEQRTAYEFLWQHAFISDATHTLIDQNCKNPDETSPLCDSAESAADGQLGNIDYLNIYAPKCYDKKVRPTASNCMDISDPCADVFVKAYLNDPKVKAAIHATAEMKKPWSRCSIGRYDLFHFGDSPKTMLPYLKDIISRGVRVWIFSGDLDSVVPVTATRHSMTKLGLPVVEEWRPWSSDGEQVAGYVIEYKGLMFATVRGSGHMVPIDQPQRGLFLFKSFVNGQPLPKAPAMPSQSTD
ncbi:hypothetical protein PR202_ga26766 [Eleusine coracana subsp. coracana]|uniref:Carboxypeptidase n=1 Tax=Eleusine coracana subsp. coracana TaxID=191504 RepID=A0AAV5DEN9_ELECO|nr:hypothetical protein PR202_ga26766 [Eleusine coracana subsp. coracana]